MRAFHRERSRRLGRAVAGARTLHRRGGRHRRYRHPLRATMTAFSNVLTDGRNGPHSGSSRPEECLGRNARGVTTARRRAATAARRACTIGSPRTRSAHSPAPRTRTRPGGRSSAWWPSGTNDESASPPTLSSAASALTGEPGPDIRFCRVARGCGRCVRGLSVRQACRVRRVWAAHAEIGTPTARLAKRSANRTPRSAWLRQRFRKSQPLPARRSSFLPWDSTFGARTTRATCPRRPGWPFPESPGSSTGT